MADATITPVSPSTVQLTPRTVSRRWALGDPRPTSQSDRARMVLDLMDPAVTDPFVVLAEDWFSEVGFDWHPHRGFETVTYVIDGELEHKDSTGGHAVLTPGDVQWTTMGHAVLHAELAYQKKGVHTLQLWLNSPAALKMIEPGYQNLSASTVPTIERDGARVRVYAGSVQGVTGPAATIWPATVIDARLSAGGHFTHELPSTFAGLMYVIEGKVRAGSDGTVVATGEAAWFDHIDLREDGRAPSATGIEIVADEETLLIFYAAAPILEPVVAYGPFVMNTREEIIQTYEDYQSGKFPAYPNW
ncbi:MAG TPA: pirin family protein [Thermomicrobiales bacterium]|nr:pirin family protein [Thermomicrobiales bacterium]